MPFAWSENIESGGNSGLRYFDHNAGSQFNPVWNLPPVLFRSVLILEPTLEVGEVPKLKEVSISVLVGFPDGIIGEARIRHE